MAIQLPIIVGVVSALLGGGLGAWGGYQFGHSVGVSVCDDERAAHTAELRKQAEEWKKLVETTRTDAAAEARRALLAQEVRDAASASSKGLIYEAMSDVDPRDCEWRPEHRLRIESVYAAWGYTPSGTPVTPGVSVEVPAPSSSALGAGGLGVGSSQLGLRLQ